MLLPSKGISLSYRDSPQQVTSYSRQTDASAKGFGEMFITWMLHHQAMRLLRSPINSSTYKSKYRHIAKFGMLGDAQENLHIPA